ncbi:uncharacterized protein LOC129575785 isoform X2 [Sitodiplosis mosellana]|uniref:uncharacterized protein LOC129575785 isoform X2 n=1 Tax=Sitodiplosis mosellana TaxID=263140 RepID=UPI002444F34A|nr:uncharacterized protein LOC129575785 isoform X2 [Sitodiplosis mosellana]
MHTVASQGLVRALFEKMSRRYNCTVFWVDEFCTTKLCSLCFRDLEQPEKAGRVKKKYRYYLCHGCEKVPEATEAVNHIHSRKTNRQLTKQRKKVRRPHRRGVRKASKFRRYKQQPANGRNMTWNRDVNAGRNILYRGWCAVMGVKLHQAFKRSVQEEEKGAAAAPPPANQNIVLSKIKRESKHHLHSRGL